jgi:hypothetical protein
MATSRTTATQAGGDAGPRRAPQQIRRPAPRRRPRRARRADLSGAWSPHVRGDEIDPALQVQLREWFIKHPVALPLCVMHLFLPCWIRFYGMASMEVFGHLRFALYDAQSMFGPTATAAWRHVPSQRRPGHRTETPACLCDELHC